MSENNNNNGHVPATNGNSTPDTENGFNFRNVGLALIPVTPVPFAGRGAFMAWGRLVMYGALASVTWKRNRPLSYLCIGAAGLSLTTSLAGNAWNNGNVSSQAVPSQAAEGGAHA